MTGSRRCPRSAPIWMSSRCPHRWGALRAEIAAADALIIASPEYAHGMPGSLKNALDWLVSALEALGKPVLLVSASPGGAAHAHAQLAEVLRTMNLPLVDGARTSSRGRASTPGAARSATRRLSRWPRGWRS